MSNRLWPPRSPITIDGSFITPVNYNGLTGRLITLPAHDSKNSRPIVLLGGHHNSHERMLSFGQFLQDYGTVYMIDLPGFGGMHSFATIGVPITHESYASYLYSVLKAHKLQDDVLIFAISISSEFVTRMFQLHPDSTAWVRRFVAFVGFGAGKDFHIPRIPKVVFYSLAWIVSSRIGARVMKVIFLNPLVLNAVMRIFAHAKQKMQHDDPKLKRQMIAMEKYLWYCNDLQTQGLTTIAMFTRDLRIGMSQPIAVEMHNIVAAKDQYFNQSEVRKTFYDLYSSHQEHTIQLGVHMPSMLSDKSEVAGLFDPKTLEVITR